jgi:hypothetical protein
MPICYGDITIIKQTMIQTLMTWVNWEKNKEDEYIFLFENNEIYDLKDKYVNFNYKFLAPLNGHLALYFEKPRVDSFNVVYFKVKNPNMNTIFSAYSKNSLCIPSEYNSVYYCHKNLLEPEVFGIKRIQSTADMPRYQFAYDTEEFTKDEIIYVLYSILK